MLWIRLEKCESFERKKGRDSNRKMWGILVDEFKGFEWKNVGDSNGQM